MLDFDSSDKYFPSKMEVYQEALNIRIKTKQKEIDQGIVIKMFKNLNPKVHMANENGLTKDGIF